MRVLVYAPEDCNNICVLTRTLEVLGVDTCFVYDPNRLIRARYGKSYSRRLKTVSAGAFFRIKFQRVPEPLAFVRQHTGRSIATVPDQSATSLYEFEFCREDLLVFRSEGHGLPPRLIEACDASLTIPQQGKTQSLNLSVASGIILAEWLRQAGAAVHGSAGCGIPGLSKRYERRDVTYDD